MEVTVKEGKKVKKKGAVAMGFDRNHFGYLYGWRIFDVYIQDCLSCRPGRDRNRRF